MILQSSIFLYCGGPGSGCHGPSCGRPVKGYLTNSQVFKEPARPSHGEMPMDHYVVHPDGEVLQVPEHRIFFRNLREDEGMGYNDFLKSGGITVTSSHGGPGVTFGRADEDTVDKVLQILAHPAFREGRVGVAEYYNPDDEKNNRDFSERSMGDMTRELRSWLGKKAA